jgi:hypothetical protein
MNWIVTKTQQILTALSEVFTTTLFEVGGKPFSLSSLVELIFLALIALIISRTLTEGIKRQLLVRFKFDRGTREAIASVINYVLLTLPGSHPRGFFVHRPNLPKQDCSNPSRGRISRSVRIYASTSLSIHPSSGMPYRTQG